MTKGLWSQEGQEASDLWGLFPQQFCGWLEGQLPRHETSVVPWAPQYPYLEIPAMLTFEPEWMGE